MGFKLPRGRVLLSFWPLLFPHWNIPLQVLLSCCANCSEVHSHLLISVIWLSTQCWENTKRLSKQYSYSTKIYLFNQVLFRHTQSKQQRLLDCQKLIGTHRSEIVIFWLMSANKAKRRKLTFDKSGHYLRTCLIVNAKLLIVLFYYFLLSSFVIIKWQKLNFQSNFFKLTSSQMTSGGLI